MLQDYLKWVKNQERDIILVLAIILTAIICFNLGRLSAINDKKPEIQINMDNLPAMGINPNISDSEVKYVGSKTGSVYHLESCPGAKAIKKENKIIFNSKKEAETAGYRPAANCPGLN